MDQPEPQTGVSESGGAATFAEGAPIFTLLSGLAERIGIAGIDRLWVFPPRRRADAETAVVVASAFQDDDDARRRVFTAHYMALTDRKGRIEIQEHVEERALAPAERIGRLVEGVLQRVEDDLAEAPPRTAHIDGDPDHWRELLDSLRTDPRWGGAARQYQNTVPTTQPGPTEPPTSTPTPTGRPGDGETGGTTPPAPAASGGTGEGGSGGAGGSLEPGGAIVPDA